MFLVFISGATYMVPYELFSRCDVLFQLKLMNREIVFELFSGFQHGTGSRDPPSPHGPRGYLPQNVLLLAIGRKHLGQLHRVEKHRRSERGLRHQSGGRTVHDARGPRTHETRQGFAEVLGSRGRLQRRRLQLAEFFEYGDARRYFREEEIAAGKRRLHATRSHNAGEQGASVDGPATANEGSKSTAMR